ncbi:S41 family peptidase [Gracilimonas mengyeensis]|uniref:Peptidase family S41 n=1 Tax=Gracilimonas mengyeensis TaxID=1302730 RepID=A0A521BB39_9BACT|nr:S41 family peptidase [Gracilimonas mengyeensis]SMO44306.1 Peptidase family S41 [Gracilimonas mengyeensis]
MMKKILLAGLFLGCISCDSLVFDDSPTAPPLEVYDAFVEELKTKNPFLQYLSVDVDSLFEANRRLIKKKKTGQQLIASIDEILIVIKDAHTVLVYDEADRNAYINYSEWLDLYPENRLSDISHYFDSYTNNKNGSIQYGRLLNTNIGYISINRMPFREFRKKIRSYNDMDGVIIDLRSAYTKHYISIHDYDIGAGIVKMLSDSSRTYLYKRTKLSSGDSDFSNWQQMRPSIPDNHKQEFSNPIVVLTNRQTKDAAELLTAGLKKVPTVTVIGDTTAGFIGNPDFTHLSGVWYMQVSNEEFKLPDNYQDSSHRFRGIPPDSIVHINPDDAASGIDTILEAAIEVLSP